MADDRMPAVAAEFDGLELLATPILRIAGWPIETLRAFADTDLNASADRVVELEKAVEAERAALCASLADAAANPSPHSQRRDVDDLRRTLSASTEPLQDGGIGDLDVGHPLAGRLAAHLERRRRLWAMTLAFEGLWQSRFDDERALLHGVAAEDRFLKALAISSTALYDAWRSARRKPSRADSARARRLDRSVWRLLLRATTRPTPFGLWAATQQITATPQQRYRVGVRLAGFAEILRAGLATHRDGSTLLRRDPSLHLDGADWTWLVIGSHGTTWTRVQNNLMLERIIEVLTREGELEVDAIAAEVSDEDPPRPDVVRLIWRLVDRGILQPAAVLPGAAPDTWAALHSATAKLSGEFGSLWCSAVAELRGRCAEMESRMEVWSADQVRDHLQLCTAIVDRLRREVGLTDSTANVVSVDSTSAHDVRAFTSPAYAVAARAAIGLAAASAGVTGCMEAYRRATVAELMTLLTGTAPQPINEVARRWDMMLRDRREANVRLAAMDPFDTYLGLFDRRFGSRPWLALDLQVGVDAWEEWLDGSWLQPVFGGRAEPAVPAFGHGSALLVDDGRGELAFHAARPQPGAFHGRHAPPDDVTMLFHEALSGCVEIVGRDCVEPAVATRSRLAGHRIDLTAADSDSMGSWRITATDDGRIWLVHSSAPDSLLAPVYNSSAAIGWLDPLSDLLYKAAMSHGWELQSVGCPTHPAERVCWRHQPEIRIEGAESSATVAGRRWTVAAESVEHATAQEKSRRFLEWRRATGHLALPEIVSVRGTDPEQTPRTCVVSSALSVDTLLHDLAQAPPVSELVISAVPLGSRSGFQICDQDGSYVWEAAQPWRVTPVGEGNSVHDDVVEALDQPLDIDAAVGRMQPYRDAGQSWLHLDAAIVGDSGWQDLADLLAGLRHEGVTDTWWYVHKPPGLRLRLHENEVGRLAEFIRQRQADAPGLQIDAIGHYEPELTRFGGAGGLALAHRHFVADSALALKCRTAPAVGADLSRTVGIWTAHAMFMRVAEDRAELRDLWTRLHTAVADSSNSRQEPDPELITIVQRCLTGTFVPTARPADDAVVVRAARWGQRIGDAAADLRRREGLAVRDWAASVVIFHWNRWALTPSVSAPMVNAMLARLPTD